MHISVHSSVKPTRPHTTLMASAQPGSTMRNGTLLFSERGLEKLMGSLSSEARESVDILHRQVSHPMPVSPPVSLPKSKWALPTFELKKGLLAVMDKLGVATIIRHGNPSQNVSYDTSPLGMRVVLGEFKDEDGPIRQLHMAFTPNLEPQEAGMTHRVNTHIAEFGTLNLKEDELLRKTQLEVQRRSAHRMATENKTQGNFSKLGGPDIEHSPMFNLRDRNNLVADASAVAQKGNMHPLYSYYNPAEGNKIEALVANELKKLHKLEQGPGKDFQRIPYKFEKPA
jgi:hypothetical protein